jgi:5,10-methylenetetrahydromethanopterin reductase
LEFGARFIGWFNVVNALNQVEFGTLAERHGFDYCWFPHDTFMRNTWVLTSALAVRTNRIKLATVGTNPYTFDPCEIATYVATLDEISHGRAVLGLGLHTTDMLAWVGIDAKNALTRTREAVQLVRQTLKTAPEKKPEPFNGTEFHWNDQAYLRFEPVRSNVPIFVAAYGRDYLELSGEIGDGSLPMITPPESSSLMVNSILKGCERAHRGPSEMNIVGFAWISISKSDPKKARELLKPIISYFGPYLEEEALATVGLSLDDFASIRKELDRGRYDLAKDLVTDEMLQLGITGSVSECIERIAKTEKMGINQISLGGPWGPDVPEAIKLVGEEIIPALKQK